MKYIFILLFILPIYSYSQDVYYTIDDWNDSTEVTSSNLEYKLSDDYTLIDDEYTPVEVEEIYEDSHDSNRITKINHINNIYDYEFLVLTYPFSNHADTLKINRDSVYKFLYLKSSGYDYSLGTSENGKIIHIKFNGKWRK